MHHRDLRIVVLLPGLIIGGGCQSVVQDARVVSSTASHVIIVPDEVVRQHPQGQRERFIRTRRLRGLPRRVKAWSGQSYWVVPICGGTAMISRGGPYQLEPGQAFSIECH